MGKLTEFTDANFQSEVVESTSPVLVDFFAPWCGPCRQLAPVIEQLASENEGSIKIGKLNTDDSPNIARTYEIFNIPTLILFKGGQVVEKFVGMQPKAKLQQALDMVKGA